jgi:hypothetical protein
MAPEAKESLFMTTLFLRALPPLAALALAAALTALLLGGLAAPPAARAQVDPAAADGLGSIAGMVVDENGTPLGGMQVDFYAFFEPGFRPGEWSSVRAVDTDAHGRYTALLTPGTYRVRFSDPAGVYGLQFYSNVTAIESAQDVVIAGNAVTGVDARLQAGGSITGALHHVGDMRVIDVAAYTLVEGEWQEVRKSTAKSPPDYSIPGLPPGTYRVCLRQDQYAASNAIPCYDHISGGVDYATDVVVAAGAVISGINLVGQDFVDYATISGTVTNEGHTPLAGIQVTAWTNGTYFTATNTDVAGTYDLPVVARGGIQVQFSNPDGLYQDQWFDGSSTITDASDLELKPFQVRDGVDAILPLGGRITGTWSNYGAFPMVHAVTVPGGNVVSSATFRLTPNYQLGGLPPGVYHVCEQHMAGGYYYTFTCYPDDAPFETAANITVTAGSTVADINRTDKLEPHGGAVLTGTIVGPNLQPLRGIYVDLLYTLDSGLILPPEEAYIATIATGVDGAYRFEGLGDGSYQVRAYDPAGIYATTYYTYTPWSQASERIKVTNGTSPVLGPLHMPIGGAISGVVQRANGLPITNAVVTLLKLEQDDLQIKETWHVDASGSYHAAGLWPGHYQVCAATDSWPFFARNCYGVIPGSPWNTNGQPVTVAAGGETAGVVITLGPTGVDSVFLPQVKR